MIAAGTTVWSHQISLTVAHVEMVPVMSSLTTEAPSWRSPSRKCIEIHRSKMQALRAENEAKVLAALPAMFAEIMGRTGLHKATAFDILKELGGRGLVVSQKIPGTRLKRWSRT